MRKWYRLTALVLAFAIVLSTVSGALAQVEVDYSEYLRWVEDVKAANGLAGVISIDEGGEVLVEPSTFTGATNAGPQYTTETTQNLGTYAADSAPTIDVALEQYGKVTLAAPAAGQWQAYLAAADLWVDITGETGSTFALTFAKVQSLFMANGHAQLRCKMGDAVTETVNVGMSYSLTALPASTQEEPAVLMMAKSTGNDGIALAAEGDDNTTYNIVINYMLGNKIAADPYTASIAAGSAFSATVPNPTVQGYKPAQGDTGWGNGITFTDAAVEINLTGIAANHVVTVVYQPAMVEYIVTHHQQNIENDGYTLVATEPLHGLTDSTVPEVAAGAENTISQQPEYKGFYALLYDKPTIAADGSTVVEVYYDRNYYLMNFTLNGGYGTEPIYARYGAELGTIATPTRAGYTFKGWSLDGTNIETTMPTTMPAGNRTYIAIWEPAANAKVTVVLWGETANCTDEAKEYDYYRSGTLTTEVGKKYTYGNETLSCATEAHTHSDECIDCGKEEHVHSLENNCYTLNCDQTSHNHTTDGCTLSCTHTHTKDCYRTGSYNYYSLVETNKPTQTLTHIGNGIYTYTTTGTNIFGQSTTVTHYYLNIGEKWYCAESSVGGGDTTTISFSCSHTSHEDSCYTCGQVQFTHVHSIANGCYELTCTKTPHEHSSACNGCGKAEHTHTSDCTINVSTLFPSNLWTRVESETKEVLPDGSTVVNVYYDRTEFTLTFKGSSNYGGTNTTYGTITDKWGADIEERFFAICKNAFETAGTYSWSQNTNGGSPWTSYIGIMPQENRTYYAYDDSGTMTAYYYFETLDGEYNDEEGNVKTVIAEGSGFTVTDEDRAEFEGFTHDRSISTPNKQSFNGAKFYYTRNSYTLDFNNGVDVVRSESVKYQAPLGTYDGYVPTAPSIYEPGSVVFDGWYQNRECTGVEYDLNSHTMPAESMILYAKWLPVNRTVKFYLDKAAYDAGTKLSTHPDVTVPHGSMVKPVPATPTNGSYTFVGWFYEEDGVEKAFDFANMPVKKDLKVYGKWSSNVLKEYTILYKFKDKDGNEIEIADPTTGSALAGNTKTFDAKGGEDLYDETESSTGLNYQEGYFPVVQSHSLKLDINATETNNTNVFTFWYVQKEAVPYIVRYVDENGEELISTKVVADNRKAVVTEIFVPISGMMPDAYQKRLVVNGAEAAEDAWITVQDENGNSVKVHPDNVITFVYKEDTEHAYYKITHYIENVDGSDWVEYATSQAPGTIGTRYTASPIEISGFTYKETEYKVKDTVVTDITDDGAKLTADGLEINLYYTRTLYPYQVRYLEQGTGNMLAPPKDGEAKYGTVVAENAIGITNYVAVAPTSASIKMRIETPDASGEMVAKLNVITFYYTEREVPLHYVVEGPAGCGTVDLIDAVETTVPAAQNDESVKVVTGKAVGAKAAAANTTYKFVGWYDDEGNLLSEEADYIPTKKDDEVWVETTYYAKFEYNLTTLTIKKTGVQEIDENAAFIFQINNGLKVTIIGNDTVTITGLTVGETYTVKEIAGNWRYDPKDAEKRITLVPNPDNSKEINLVTFENERNKTQWLDSNYNEINRFTVKPVQENQ